MTDTRGGIFAFIDQIKMGRFLCTKTVWAEQITGIRLGAPGVAWLEFREGHERLMVATKWVEEKHAEPGGYFVVYQDGYTSFSPATPFVDGYERIGEGTGPR
jgi:hypothetical protein